MVDPTRSATKGRGVSLRRQSPCAIDKQSAAKGLSFKVTPRDGTPAFVVDLTEFAVGRSDTRHNTWNGTLRGRSELLNDLFPSLSKNYLHQAKSTWVSRRTALRSLWRALDELPAGFHVTRLADFTDAHGELLRRRSGSYYSSWAEILQRAVEDRGLAVLNWPASLPSDLAIIDVFDEKFARRINHALRSEIREIKRKWRFGDILAAGETPLGVEIDVEAVRRLREFCQNYLDPLPRPDSANFPFRRDLPIPSYSAPGERGPRDIGRDAAFPDRLATGPRSVALRWWYPTAAELAIFFLAVMIGTGWNVSTVANLDVSEEDTWCQPHPLAADVVVLKSLKTRPMTFQRAVCLRRPEFHPYRIVSAIIERTAPLRAELRKRLSELDKQIAASKPARSMNLQSERDKIIHAIRSPWIYFSGRNLDQIGCFYTFQPLKTVGVVLRAVLAKHGICNEDGSPLAVKPSDFRDAWIGFAYANSGHSWLVAKLAAGHRSIDALRNYLRQRRWRAYSEEAVSRFQDSLWGEIRARRIVDGTVLRLMMRRGSITAEQRRKLVELRERTIVGVGCGSPTGAPPRELAPGHPDHLDCMIQRCVICRYALIFEDSFAGLCRRMAELRHLRTEVFSVTAWVESSFSDEEDALTFILSELFNEDRSVAEIDRWATAIRSGEHRVFESESLFGSGKTYG